jgi:hypothetical protein
MEIHSFEGALRLFSGGLMDRAVQSPTPLVDRGILLEDISGTSLFVEATSGSIRSERVSGSQTYITHQGSLLGRELQGHVEFATSGAGRVDIKELTGFASGRTELGSIEIDARDWRFDDAAVFESAEGSITLRFPAAFSAELDLQSATGRTDVAFADIAGARLSSRNANSNQESETQELNFWAKLKQQASDGLAEIARVGAETLGLREPVSNQPAAVPDSDSVGPFPPGKFVGSVGESSRGRGVVRARSGGGAISVLRSLPTVRPSHP